MICLYVYVINFILLAIEPTILVTPESPVQRGQSVIVTCSLSREGSIAWTWMTTAPSANISNQVGNLGIMSQLILPFVDSGYCGIYTCIAFDQALTSFPSNTFVNVGRFQDNSYSSLNICTYLATILFFSYIYLLFLKQYIIIRLALQSVNIH